MSTTKITLNELRNLVKQILSEASSAHFVISKKTKKMLPHGPFNSREYWIKGGKAEGKIDTEIEVFGYNHKQEAELLYNALKNAGLEDRYYSIKIEVK